MTDQDGADASLNTELAAAPEPESVDAEAQETEVVEAEISESAAESPPAEETEDKPDPFQERIDKLTRRYRETERLVQDREQQITELQKRLDEKPAPEAVKTLADFEYDNEKYLEYRLSESEKRAKETAESIARNYEATSTQDKSFQEFVSREAEYARDIDDYHDVVHDPKLKITATMAGEIQESDLGPELAYHLGKNPDIAEEISRLPERQIVRRIALLEARLKAEKSKAGNKVSKAPPPPTKIQGKEPGMSVSTTDPSSDKLSDAEWFKREEKRQAKLRG